MALLLFHDWCVDFILLGCGFHDAAFGELKIPMRRSLELYMSSQRYNGKTSNLTLEQHLVARGKNLEAGEGGVVSGKEVVRFVSVGVRHLKGQLIQTAIAFLHPYLEVT